MAILAHEIGHVIWWDEQIPQMICPAEIGDVFYAITWQDNAIKRGFHGFGGSRGSRRAYYDFTYKDILRAVQKGRTSTATSEMYNLYNGNRWINLFSFVEPDEDFIETYKFWVLTHAQDTFGLQSLSIRFRGSGGDVPIVSNNTFGQSSSLAEKRAWIEDYVAGSCGY
jgi:hypothetical protein